jgi:hypothetical protein
MTGMTTVETCECGERARWVESTELADLWECGECDAEWTIRVG